MTSFRIRPRRGTAPSTAALAAALGLGFASPDAAAETMDFALERLVRDESCRTSSGAATFGADGDVNVCRTDDAAFKRLINHFGTAIAPSAMYPARTTGFGGFEIALEGVYTTIDQDADYLARGTRGRVDSTGNASTRNDDIPAMFQLYSLRIRKGFGFGLETGLQFGYLTNTSLLAGGFDARIALLEGFRGAVGDFIPDVAAMGSVRTITGTSQLQLTVASASGTISKPFTIASSGVLTPWAGYQYLWIFGDSGTIDMTPSTDALDLCGYSGPNQPGYPEPAGSRGRDGAPICTGTNSDFNNTQVFRPARLERQRLFFGLNYRYELLSVGGQVMFDVIPPADAQVGSRGDEDAAILRDEPTQFSFALQVGAQF